eukprot:CAMPEP_0119125818 /NCGR_PEP_ID=MMETSP1310-20130426/4964_1 /TAXON_ID=464262 /ORGANISM="Genus nov. species nov., Strain RCC2339" /LENGTH=92 /DNA_ID=CAMNT_0007115925 /DNA_START=249 /DNA_END=523 /DNA_ORIENTATION=+
MNRNVGLVLAFVGFNVAADSVMLRQLFSAFVYMVGGESNALVGLVASTSGLAQILFAFPGGLLGDSLRRDTVLRIAGCLGVISMAVSGAAFA